MAREALFGRASSLRQAVNRSRLAEAARSPALIQEMIGDREGYFDIRTVGWDSYWQACLDLISPKSRETLEDLRRSREAFFASRFDQGSAVQYCWDYFRLLRLALSGGQGGLHFIKAVMGLEVFGLRGFFDKVTQAAGVISVRHPAYLLAKLREPLALDDPKFLPLVCLPPIYDGFGVPTKMFYHYRQAKVDKETDAALLLYPAADLDSRGASFAAIEKLWAALRSSSDPRSRRRAEMLADKALAPFLRARKPLASGNRAELALADLGGGTGALVSRLCDRMLTTHKEVVAGRSFAWTFVDLSIQDPARHTGARRLRAAMSVAEYEQADYKTWALKRSSGATAPHWDAILLCRLLNNLSLFSVQTTSDRRELLQLAGEVPPGESLACHMPCQCLEPSTPNAAALLASNSRLVIRGGTSFRQLSLSDYFAGLHRLSGYDPVGDATPNTAFFPLRRLNHDSLVLADGSSLFERLCAVGELVIIEDVDLTPVLLRQHLESHRLKTLAASDATEPKHMRSANLLCVTRRDWVACLPGTRLW